MIIGILLVAGAVGAALSWWLADRLERDDHQ